MFELFISNHTKQHKSSTVMTRFESGYLYPFRKRNKKSTDRGKTHIPIPTPTLPLTHLQLPHTSQTKTIVPDVHPTFQITSSNAVIHVISVFAYTLPCLSRKYVAPISCVDGTQYERLPCHYQYEQYPTGTTKTTRASSRSTTPFSYNIFS